MQQLSLERFAMFEGRSCAFRIGSIEVPMECVKVARARAPEGFECFTVEFRGPAENVLQQQMVQLQAGDFQTDLFVVPIGVCEDGALYEAVINRQVEV